MTDRTQDQQRAKVRKLIKDARIAMLTSVAPDGKLISKPMATQDVELDGDVWFIAERDSQKVRNIEARPHVNVSYSDRSSWLSLSGTATVVDDSAKLDELWNTFTDAWLEGGPENPNNVLIRVEADSAEYWDSPGGRLATAFSFVKAKVTGERIDAGENAKVDL
jgi:general stress protein 26